MYSRTGWLKRKTVAVKSCTMTPGCWWTVFCYYSLQETRKVFVVLALSSSVMFSPLLKETIRTKSAAAKDGGCGVRGSSLSLTRRTSGLAPVPAATAQVSRSLTPCSAPLRGGAAVQRVCPIRVHRPCRTRMFRGRASHLVGVDSRRARRAANEISAVAGGWRGAGVAEGDRGLPSDWLGHRAYSRLLNLQLRRHSVVFLLTQMTYEHQPLRPHCPHSHDTSWAGGAPLGRAFLLSPKLEAGSAPQPLRVLPCFQRHRAPKTTGHFQGSTGSAGFPCRQSSLLHRWDPS